VCDNVVFSVTVWRTLCFVMTVTEIVNWDMIVLYSCGEQRVCRVCGNVVFSGTVCRTEKFNLVLYWEC
jgi:hypothetical protein